MEGRAELSILAMKNSQTEVFNEVCDGDRIQEQQENIKKNNTQTKQKKWRTGFQLPLERMMRPWSAAEVRLLPGRPDFFSPCRHLVVESDIASGEGKPTKWGRQKVFPGQRGAPSQRDWRRSRISENTAASHLLLDTSASHCLVSMSEVYHCSSQEAISFKRKVLDNLILYFAQISMFSQPDSL